MVLVKELLGYVEALGPEVLSHLLNRDALDRVNVQRMAGDMVGALNSSHFGIVLSGALTTVDPYFAGVELLQSRLHISEGRRPLIIVSRCVLLWLSSGS